MKKGSLWTIDELGAAVAAALAEGYDGPPNGRVRDVPDRRTIRYYTTLGLLDSPAEMKGRTALYGRRHLLQLVAIKQLQARGQSLAAVQRTLVGQPDGALERFAGLKVGTAPRVADAPREAPPRAAGFWRAVPEPLAAGPARPERPQPGPLETLQGVRLGEGVTLLLAPSRPLEEDDLEALRRAATALLAVLDRRQLMPRPTEEETP
jgi:DNA-binding transcriptional MerR regulator